MDTDQILLAVVVLLTAVVIAGGVAKKLNLGSIVALLAVGMALGPHSPKPLLTDHVDELQAVGEIGVVLLLFLVGLGTQPTRLLSMRRLVLGLGTAQLLLTAAAIAGLLIAVALEQWQWALIVGLGLAMSSDAVAISTLEERAESASPLGQAVMAVLINQSFMVIVVLAVIPILAAGPTHGFPVPNLDKDKAFEVIAAVAAVYGLGRYALPKMLTWAARRLGFESFTLIVVAGIFGAAWIMDRVGVSMALGSFMIGMILSTSEFAEQIKASVALMKGLLLGLFFIAVGMAINLEEVAALGGEFLLALPALLLIKFAIVFVLALVFGLRLRSAVLAGLLLMPLDEIAYVIFASAHGSGLLSARAYTIGLTMISFSFVLSPVLINLGYKLSDRLASTPKPDVPLKSLSESIENRVVVVGCSYVGRAICAILELAKVPYIAFEIDLDHLSAAKKRNHNAHYGDVTEPMMMSTISIARARSVILTTSGYEATKRMIGNLRQFYPDVPVMTAVQYLVQRDELRRMGASQVVALMPEATLRFSRSVLRSLGVSPDEVESIINSFTADDYAVMRGIGGVGPETTAKEASVATHPERVGAPLI
jgi:glutathione-regulated potassium-efflux system ancillary protein KefC